MTKKQVKNAAQKTAQIISNIVNNTPLTDLLLMDLALDTLVCGCLKHAQNEDGYRKLARAIVESDDDTCVAEQMDEREADLDARETALNERETNLDEREAALDERDEDLDERETSLNERETELNAREADLNEREDAAKRDSAGCEHQCSCGKNKTTSAADIRQNIVNLLGEVTTILGGF